MANIFPYVKRLQKELHSFVRQPPRGMSLDVDTIERNIKIWIINMQGTEDTLYDGEQFQLQFKFHYNYPFESPEVTFIGENIPVHPHVYSNGHICLSILTLDWSPALTVRSVCLSIMSMLSSCKEKKRPEGDSMYVQLCSKNPKETNFWYHGKRIMSLTKMDHMTVFEALNINSIVYSPTIYSHLE